MHAFLTHLAIYILTFRAVLFNGAKVINARFICFLSCDPRSTAAADTTLADHFCTWFILGHMPSTFLTLSLLTLATSSDSIDRITALILESLH